MTKPAITIRLGAEELLAVDRHVSHALTRSRVIEAIIQEFVGLSDEQQRALLANKTNLRRASLPTERARISKRWAI